MGRTFYRNDNAVSQYGLTDLLRITIPALLLIYPVAIVLVLLQFLRKKLPSIKFTYNSTLIVTVCFSLCDSLNNVKMLPESINSLLGHFPLSSEGMAWLVPTLVMLVVSILIGEKHCLKRSLIFKKIKTNLHQPSNMGLYNHCLMVDFYSNLETSP